MRTLLTMPKIFLSWSGQDSYLIADALHKWLPVMLQSIKAFMSTEDLRKGGRWNSDLSKELESTSFGIICLTPSNLTAPWILFESGALSKVVSDSNVSPLLFGVKPSDLPSPLTQFNATKFDKEDFWRLLKSINASNADDSVSEELLHRCFEASWTPLKLALDAVDVSTIDEKPNPAPPTPTEKIESILQELLVLNRTQSQILSNTSTLFQNNQVTELLRSIKPSGLPPIEHPVWIDLTNSIIDINEISNLISDTSPEVSILRDITRRAVSAIDYIMSNTGRNLEKIRETIRTNRISENIIRHRNDFASDDMKNAHDTISRKDRRDL